MSKPQDAKFKAAKCRKLALQAADPATRERWFGMERFWLNQIVAPGTAPNANVEIVEL